MGTTDNRGIMLKELRVHLDPCPAVLFPHNILFRAVGSAAMSFFPNRDVRCRVV